MKPENVKCPDCGGDMVPRNSKFGKFWGCKNYPYCTGTRDSMVESKKDKNQEREQEESDFEHQYNFNKKREIWHYLNFQKSFPNLK